MLGNVIETFVVKYRVTEARNLTQVDCNKNENKIHQISDLFFARSAQMTIAEC